MPYAWLTHPVELHSWREAPPCELTGEQCAYQHGYWRWWYEADHRYALPTVALILVAITLFTIGNAFVIFAPTRWQQGPFLGKLLTYSRLLSYTSWRFGKWNTHSLGAYLVGLVGFIFFFGMSIHHPLAAHLDHSDFFQQCFSVHDLTTGPILPRLTLGVLLPLLRGRAGCPWLASRSSCMSLLYD
jgi:hypothetical protein